MKLIYYFDTLFFKRGGTDKTTFMVRCSDCGATHRVTVRSGQVNDGGTMMHKPWCSIDTGIVTRPIQRLRS